MKTGKNNCECAWDFVVVLFHSRSTKFCCCFFLFIILRLKRHQCKSIYSKYQMQTVSYIFLDFGTYYFSHIQVCVCREYIKMLKELNNYRYHTIHTYSPILKLYILYVCLYVVCVIEYIPNLCVHSIDTDQKSIYLFLVSPINFWFHFLSNFYHFCCLFENT